MLMIKLKCHQHHHSQFLRFAGEGMGITGHRKSYAARTAKAGLHEIAFHQFSFSCTDISC
jgi:hypothetical protein